MRSMEMRTGINENNEPKTIPGIQPPDRSFIWTAKAHTLPPLSQSWESGHVPKTGMLTVESKPKLDTRRQVAPANWLVTT